MSWSMIGKPTTQVADHQLVERFAKMQRFSGDRPLSKDRCERLRSLLEEGRFRTCAWAVCKCLEDGKEYRINGQHTSKVLSEFNGSLPAVFVTVERYEADTLQDVAELFATFDPRWSVRSTADTNNAWAQSIPELANVHSRVINLAASGMATHYYLTASRRFSQEARGRMISKNVKFVLWIDGLDINLSSKSHLRRAAPVAAMYATFLVDLDAATEFWTEVRNGSGASPETPSRVLEKFLLKSDSRSQETEMFAKCIHAWNSFRRGDTKLGTLKWFPNAPRPEAI